MKLKRLTALLLAALMLVSLAACGRKAEDPSVVVRLYESFLKAPGLKDFSELVAGDLAGDPMYRFMKAYYALMGMSEEDFAQDAASDVEGTKLRENTVKDLTKEELAAYQDEVAAALEHYRSMLDDLKDTTDEGWAMTAEDYGMSPEEAIALGKEAIAALEDIIAALDGLKIDQGKRVTITTERAGGETEEEEFCFFLAGDRWFTDLLLEMNL